MFDLNDSNDGTFEDEDEERDSDSGTLSAQQYSVSKYTVGYVHCIFLLTYIKIVGII